MNMRLTSVLALAAILSPLPLGHHAPAWAQGARIESFRTDLGPAAIESARANRTRALASSAYIWGIPAFLNLRLATEFKLARRAIAPGEEPFGGWMLIRSLSTPQTDNAMPNVDTLYGASFVLLDKQGPVVLTTPDAQDRYVSVALHDAYFNNFAVVGARDGGRAHRVLIAPPGWKGRAPDGVDRVIEAPTNTIVVFQRVFTSGGDDLAKARAIQDRIRIAPVAGGPSFPNVATPEFDFPVRLRETTDPLAYFGYVNTYTAANRPSEQYAAMMVAFGEVGLGPGARLPQEKAFREAIVDGAGDGKRTIDAAISSEAYRNGWRVPDPRGATPGPYALAQAVLQITQIGSLPVSEAVYYVGRRDAQDAPLDGRNAYALTFPAGALPPVKPEGFWSVTMYKASDTLLAANEIDRYVIRPSTPGLARNPDGSLTIRMSHAKPDGGLENWLPAPRDGFVVTLRAYLPTQAIADGSWFPPAIRRLDQ